MTPEQYADELTKYDYDYFINKALDNVPDTVDSRQGSIIFDALAPTAYSFAEIVQNIRTVLLSTYTQTADNEFLDYRGQEKGLSRYLATATVATATFVDSQGNPVEVDEGDRFASIGAAPYFYKVTKVDKTGQAELTCEVTGTDPNHYVGQILPVTPNDDLATATITDISVPARDQETDDDFRARILEQSTSVAYGGNIADYQRMIAELESVGAVQVWPTWNGGGTVKLVIVDNDYDLPSDELVGEVQQAIDPTDDSGQGYGLAPIGHTVTVVAPVSKTIPISMTIEIDKTTTIELATASAKELIETYFDSVRHQFGHLDTGSRTYAQSIYRSQVLAAVLKVSGVVNVTDLLLDGVDADVQLIMTKDETELPELGEVTINEPTV